MIVAFDLDGTLIDSHNLIRHTAELTIQNFSKDKGFALKEIEFGKPIREFLKGHIEESHLDSAVSFYRNHLENCDEIICGVFEGTISMLKILRPMTEIMVVITNKQSKSAIHFLQKHLMMEFFDGVFGSDKGKPKPSSDLLILANPLQLSPFYFIGDQAEDILASKNYGSYSILFDPLNNYTAREWAIQPDFIVNSMSQLSDFFQNMHVENLKL